ncbi:SDR family NAD(P)-dependent oxidoreductase [Acinetobacter oleivorans]|uniref:SDR family NAD(P)-dependent oxidoreductase n=1 Tax=Acinetobacter oleivorans TaxID=1148157 RepID=UPI001CD274BD|nr:SDR family oxidoreductase [Acinetobacter oleivorans]
MTHGIEIFSLKGKTALITGAVGYLGTSMAFALAEAGAKVFINSRSRANCQRLVDKIQAKGLLAECAVFDVSSETAVRSFAYKLQGEPLHILINNAYAGGAGNIEVSKEQSYLESYNTSLVAAHRLMQALLPNLRLAVAQSKDASVINISSMYAMVSPDPKIYASSSQVNPPFYGAAKAALLQWTKYAACEFGFEKIRVNAVSPGPFPSDQVQNSNPLFIDMLSKKVPMGRIGRSEEIKGPVLFLASPASSYVNGANIVVDGGWTSW